ncbi:MAG TPA: hypothetical protein VM010_01975, partial [Chitinophagaceae bacterium]|nr:hypothetical protein [Chitinophagaceae bacterium]
MKQPILLCLLALLANTLVAQVAPPALNQIRTEDLKRDLYALADARFRGRSAGTLDELKAAAWLAEKYKAIGLKPAGDDGTYFQFFTMWRNHLSDSSTIQLNGTTLPLWKEAAVAQMANGTVHAPVVYLGNAAAIDTNTVDVKGKVVALEANATGINLDVSLPTWRYGRYM